MKTDQRGSLRSSTASVIALLWICQPVMGETGSSPSFEKDIKPIFEKHCLSCHSSQTHSSGLVLESLESTRQGGVVNGAAVIAGKGSASPIIQYLRHEKKPPMPMGLPPLPEDRIALIETWINQLPTKENVQAKEKQYPWPFTQLTSPSVPEVKQKEWVRNPIDAFVLTKLEQKGLQPAPPVSQRALLRRLYFDLIGLPPTPDEMNLFLNNPAPDAYEQEIEKLLADPRYGERWARHWLDLVRYADSGGGGLDVPLPHLWRYRDYVIRAFNQDRPYDRFVREQIAGDAFSGYGAEGKIGAGFLRLGVSESGSGEETRRYLLIDLVNTTGSVFLGLTIGCARCHDHKYDPIPTRDYYRMEAFFSTVTIAPVPVPFTQYEQPETLAKKGKEWEELLTQRKKSNDLIWSRFMERMAKARFLRDPQDVKDLAVPISDGTLGFDSELREAMEEGLLFSKEEAKLHDQITRERSRFVNPNQPDLYKATAYSATESFGSANPIAPTTYVLKAGNMENQGEAVKPGFLSAAIGKPDGADLEGLDIRSSNGSWRKLLADWIASPRNPLTARVMVNRIWQRHFGQGLVTTPSDFGKNGGGTAHPELIDWLASQFIESGWSLKAMHRLMLKSNMYRQSLQNPRSREYAKIDPEKRFFWQMNPLRLEGEAIRDSILAVSGQLNPAMGGPYFFPDIDIELQKRAGTWWEPSPKEDRNRRSIYMLQQRALEYPMFRVFDGTNLNESCELRRVTTVTPQVFALFNNKSVHEQSREMASRVVREAGDDPARQVERAFQLAFQRSPTALEKVDALEYIGPSKSSFGSEVTSPGSAEASTGVLPKTNKTDPPKGTLADLCLVLFNTNEFVFLE